MTKPGDLFRLFEQDGRVLMEHIDCHDYRRGTVTVAGTSEVISNQPFRPERGAE